MFGTSLHSHKRKTYKSAASDEWILSICKEAQARRRSLVIISKSQEYMAMWLTKWFCSNCAMASREEGDSFLFSSSRVTVAGTKAEIPTYSWSKMVINWIITMPILIDNGLRMNTHGISACGLNVCSRSTTSENGWHRINGACGIVHLIDDHGRLSYLCPMGQA